MNTECRYMNEPYKKNSGGSKLVVLVSCGSINVRLMTFFCCGGFFFVCGDRSAPLFTALLIGSSDKILRLGDVDGIYIIVRYTYGHDEYELNDSKSVEIMACQHRH